ncbi:MAG TPA: Zn-dependent hydrolase [Candidatus Saccharimonadales bacterium]|nr:Zn-dependent hydrolase [Candidatus Saccharimonadales bacterium]
MSSLPPPDQDRLWRQLMELAEFRELDQPGWTRRLFSEPYQRSRAWTRDLMEAAGLEVQADAVGNLLGRLAGVSSDVPELVIGSHTDTVAGGGRFDGMVGVVAAVEVARLLGQTGRRLRHSLLVVDFLGEEPNRFGISCVGSAAVVGQLGEELLRLTDEKGDTLAAALAGIGASPGGLSEMVWPTQRLHGYLELHIEQGARLEREGIRLGVVTSIAGIHRGVITLVGRPDHAGTAAMDDRRDALAAAAEVVLLVERLARESRLGGDGVGTVGRLEIAPGAANVVPGMAIVWVEFRSAESKWLDDRHRALEAGVRDCAARRRLEVEIEWISEGSPVACAPGPRRAIVEAIEELGQAHLELPSGASHDAALLAQICPIGMIFIPSREGRSHCPEEWTDPEDVALGAEALLGAVLRLDLADSL